MILPEKEVELYILLKCIEIIGFEDISIQIVPPNYRWPNLGSCRLPVLTRCERSKRVIESTQHCDPVSGWVNRFIYGLYMLVQDIGFHSICNQNSDNSIYPRLLICTALPSSTSLSRVIHLLQSVNPHWPIISTPNVQFTGQFAPAVDKSVGLDKSTKCNY